MSRTRKKNPGAAFEDLEWLVKNGKAAPEVDPKVLKVSSIKLMPEVFQHRRPAQHFSDGHIRILADAVKAQGLLAPVMVWWSGKHWVCVDGHHRLAAYTKAGMRDHEVPVEVFRGTPGDALACAAATNSQDKLPMTKAEKVNAGWRLVILADSLSISRQARSAGISDRQVALMRSTKKRLLALGQTQDQLAEMSWEAARRLAAGEQLAEWSAEEEERRVQEMAEALRKALGPTAERQPEVFAKAVERYSTKLAKSLEAWFSGDPYEEDQGALEDV